MIVPLQSREGPRNYFSERPSETWNFIPMTIQDTLLNYQLDKPLHWEESVCFSSWWYLAPCVISVCLRMIPCWFTFSTTYFFSCPQPPTSPLCQSRRQWFELLILNTGYIVRVFVLMQRFIRSNIRTIDQHQSKYQYHCDALIALRVYPLKVKLSIDSVTD